MTPAIVRPLLIVLMALVGADGFAQTPTELNTANPVPALVPTPASVTPLPATPSGAPPNREAPAGLPKAYAVPKDAADAPPAPPKIKVDQAISAYRKVTSLNGNIRSIGSSTLSSLVLRWSSEFKLLYPDVDVIVTGGGSESAPLALLVGTAELAPMSRPMRESEIAAFKAKFGYEPTRLTVGLDAIAVYVNKNNPLTQISIKNLDGIFSATHKRGSEPIKTWGQLNLSNGVGNSIGNNTGDDWKTREIILKGPSRAQGIYSLFKELVLDGGDFRFDLRAEPVASSIVQGVGAEDGAIGFASYFFHSARTRALAVSATGEPPFIKPDQENVSSGTYPLARSLYIYINLPAKGAPPGPASASTIEFLKFICSLSGQEIAARDGNYPLNAATVKSSCLAPLLRE
jgi:phosphate transport system substrate-binding protein